MLYRYLGVILDHRLNWKTQCKALRSKALKFLTASSPLLRSFLASKATLLVYKSYVRPVMTYVAPAWAFAPKILMKRLQGVQPRARDTLEDMIGILGSKKCICISKFKSLNSGLKFIQSC